ncbi:MAG: SRPBCC family protein [Acidimicrobiia bacterium]
MPSSTASHTVAVSRSPAVLWQMMQQAETWANIGPVDKIWDPHHNDDGTLSGYRFSATVAGREYAGTATTIKSVPDSTMALDLDGGEVAGVLTTVLAGNGDSEQTNVEVTLEVSSRGTLSAMFFPVIADAVKRGLPEQVEAFAARIEDGFTG